MNDFIDPSMLRQAAAALDRISQAGQVWELKERIAADWRQACEVRLNGSVSDNIIYPITLATDLRDILKADDSACVAAVQDYLSPSYSSVALAALLDFAAELDRRPVAELIDERPAAIRRAHKQAVSHRAGRRGCA
jgi:hypothetical protein